MTDQKAGDYPIDLINEGLVAEVERLRAQRDQLLAALQQMVSDEPWDGSDIARAAIAAVEDKP